MPKLPRRSEKEDVDGGNDQKDPISSPGQEVDTPDCSGPEVISKHRTQGAQKRGDPVRVPPRDGDRPQLAAYVERLEGLLEGEESLPVKQRRTMLSLYEAL